jgi:hypothetical protein
VAPPVAPPETPEAAPALARPWRPATVALLATALVLLAVVGASRSAWRLLGAGRGLVSEAYYPVSGFALVLATTLGQVVGWAAGSALLAYAMTRAGLSLNWPRLRLAMSLVYLGLAVLPLGLYHVLAGGWLLGLPRTGLAEWLAAHHPDAHWLVITAHPAVDLSLLPLAAVFLAALWGAAGDVRSSVAAQTVVALALFGTSLAVALSLAIHSILVHVRL